MGNTRTANREEARNKQREVAQQIERPYLLVWQTGRIRTADDAQQAGREDKHSKGRAADWKERQAQQTKIVRTAYNKRERAQHQQ